MTREQTAFHLNRLVYPLGGYPTRKQINEADKAQLQKWFEKLPRPDSRDQESRFTAIVQRLGNGG